MPLSGALVVAIFLGGFINLVPVPGVTYPATLVIDGLVLLMVAGGFANLLRPGTQIIRPWMLWLFFTAFGFATLTAIGTEPLGARISQFRSHVLYAFVAVYLVTTVRNREQLHWLLRLFMKMSALIAAFGVFQFVFRTQLPDALLYSKDTDLFGYFGSDITRSTGLMGNTIVFGSVMNLAYALHLSRLAVSPSVRHFALSALVCAGGIVTFSRVSIIINVALTVAILVVAAYRRDPAKTLVGGFFLATLVVPATVLMTLATGGYRALAESFIVSELFSGKNAAVAGSTSTHFYYIDYAIQTIQQHPWIGVGVATQKQDSNYGYTHTVVTDGAIWTTAMEVGLIVAGTYAITLLLVMAHQYRVWRTDRLEWPALGLLLFSVLEFGFASVYNSGWFGKGPFLLYWIVFGLVAASFELQRGREPGVSRTRRTRRRSTRPTYRTGAARLSGTGSGRSPASVRR